MYSPLSFEEFVARDTSGIPYYNNFWLYFCDVPGAYYRTSGYFALFKCTFPGMEADLTKKITDARNAGMDVTHAVTPHEAGLYEAYLKMRQFVKNDEELFV